MAMTRRVHPLVSLNPYQGNWTIKVRVTGKGNMRTYKNARGEGCVFNVELTDEDGTQIQATMFNEAAKKFYEKFQLGKVYYISKGTLRVANKQFKTVQNDYEMTLNEYSEVEEASNEATFIPETKFCFVLIDELGPYVNSKEFVDVIGVVQSVSPTMSIRRKMNNEIIPKREITIADESFPDRRGLEEDGLDHFQEASHRLKLILQLEKRLQDQVVVRCALEKGLGYQSSSHDVTNETSIPKPATELIKEIAILELEVGHLEQYLLSLYRKAFDQQIPPSLSMKDERLKSPLTTPRGKHLLISRSGITTKREIATFQARFQSLANPWNEFGEEKVEETADHRCQSSLSNHSVLPTRTSPPAESLGKAVRACHSQPLSMMETRSL